MWRIFAEIQQGLIMLGQALCGTDCSSLRDGDAARKGLEPRTLHKAGRARH